jgi:hypothetical protein
MHLVKKFWHLRVHLEQEFTPEFKTGCPCDTLCFDYMAIHPVSNAKNPCAQRFFLVA